MSHAIARFSHGGSRLEPDDVRFRNIAGVMAIAAAPLAFASLIVGFIALDYNMEAFSDPRSMIGVTTHANLLRWSVLLNMFGYYLLWLPAVLYGCPAYRVGHVARSPCGRCCP